MNNCVNKSWPCRTLQAVLDKCPDVADIHVLSPTLTINDDSCFVSSNKSYTISSAQDGNIQVICTQGRHSSQFYENVYIILAKYKSVLYIMPMKYLIVYFFRHDCVGSS